MGQQQLLLLVLGIVIVGLAVVVGIQAFSENQKKANADALVNDAIRIASDTQAWMLKPTAFGGGNNSCASTCSWTGVTFAQLGYPVGDQPGGETAEADQYENINGIFDFAPSGATVTITAESVANGNTVVVTVSGTESTDIATAVNAAAAS